MALTYISNQFIITRDIYIRSFQSTLTIQSIESFLNVKKEYWWLGYIFIPLVVCLKVLFTALCVSIGSMLWDIKFKFRVIFKAALLGEIIFIIAQVIYLINLFFHMDTLTLQTFTNYFPLTVLSYFGTANVVDWLEYPLQTLNLFEVFYIVAIAWLLTRQWKQDFMESLAVVFPSYMTGLVLWLALVTFLTLQVS